MRRIVCFVLLGIASLSAAAAPQTWNQKVGAWVAMTQLSAITMGLQVEAGDPSGAAATAAKATDDLDKEIKQHLLASKGHPEVTADLKAFYLAAKAYFHDAIPDGSTPAILAKANEQHLKQDLDNKARALQLDLDTL